MQRTVLWLAILAPASADPVEELSTLNVVATGTLRARVETVSGRNYCASAGGYPGAGYLTVGAPAHLADFLRLRPPAPTHRPAIEPA